MTNCSLSYESRDKVRDVMSSILKSAVTYGLLLKNPMEAVRLSAGTKGNRIKPYIDPAKFSALLALIPEPYATMVYVAAFTGLRVSELIGLKWKNVHGDSITIEERYCRGEWGTPKSKASNATIAVNTSVIDRIHWLKTVTVEVKAGTAVRRYAAVKATGPDDLVFASVVKGIPMRGNNILCRFREDGPGLHRFGLVLPWRVTREPGASRLPLVDAKFRRIEPDGSLGNWQSVSANRRVSQRSRSYCGCLNRHDRTQFNHSVTLNFE